MSPASNYLKGTAGALVGAALGAALFIALLRGGLYSAILIGAGAGWGSQLLFLGRSPAMGAVAGLIGLAAGVLAEWYAFPFVADQSLPFFLRNLPQVDSIHLLFLGIGAALAFFWGQGK